MYKEWLKIVFAAVFEVIWVVGLTYADTVLEWGGTVIAIVISFYFLIMGANKLPAGTVYAVFVGLGTAGTVLVDMIIFHEPFNIWKIVCIAILLIGIIGLKLTTDDSKNGGVA
ncbi:QacE family quaternary ammonium compound efflux SMR transporter [Gracilibacillus oryzae]|uniref:QacE family quaternary ammonium compound efflux SMR transporter n=1 Tax=Gracilibacillus oryzae TaxID=1672701 RepID=A0A7C8GRH0_9BACI|nr:SMR family transporter [Gracilibacillus oryzae]KAB8127840.1 QacE family quaternary ammonium compound efflux SMR transporter [Gracilibacillus oryzae]